jgi:hypothetical protein
MTAWSANRLAARAIALHARDAAEARDLLEMLGLTNGRRIVPDDNRNYDIEGSSPLKSAPTSASEMPTVRDRHPERCTTPAGLRELGAAS